MGIHFVGKFPEVGLNTSPTICYLADSQRVIAFKKKDQGNTKSCIFISCWEFVCKTLVAQYQRIFRHSTFFIINSSLRHIDMVSASHTNAALHMDTIVTRIRYRTGVGCSQENRNKGTENQRNVYRRKQLHRNTNGDMRSWVRGCGLYTKNHSETSLCLNANLKCICWDGIQFGGISTECYLIVWVI